MLTNIELLKSIAKQKRFTFISTGMSKMKDVEKAVKIFRKSNCKFELMHCVSAYPSLDKDLNLKMIQTYKKKFKVNVGYSGHEKSVSPSLMAVCMGATSVERHITLDRTMWGTDQSASLSEEGIKNLVSIIEKIPQMTGKEKFKKNKKEMELLKKFKYWN